MAGATAMLRLSVGILLLLVTVVVAAPWPPPYSNTKPSPPPPPPYHGTQTPPTRHPPPPMRHPPPPPPPPPPKRRPPPPPPPSRRPPPPPPPTVLHTPPPPTTLHTPPPPSTVLLTPPPPPTLHTPPPPSTVLLTPPPTVFQTPPPPPPTAQCNIPTSKCYYQKFSCPIDCPSCEVDCTACKAVCPCNKLGGLCKDPQFVGGDGLTFYFHGKKDQDFCIVSDSNLHVNAHFIGRRNNNMKRDFTWVQSLGILFDNHQLFVGAQKTSTWDDSIDRLALAFDGEPIFLLATEGAVWRPSTAPGVSFTRSRDVNDVMIEVEGNFQIKATVVPITEKDSKIHNYGITKEDCFAHLDLSFKFNSLSGVVDGILGQTYRSNYVSKIKMGVQMPVVGGAKEFASSALFSADCAVAKFSGHFNSSERFEYGSLDCASTGMDGRGVVCKR